MYRTMETLNQEAVIPEKRPCGSKEGKKARRLEALLDLTETIATLTIGAGFLLLVATCLSTL